MAALLSSEIGDTDKVVQYINETRDLGIEVLPPDVNESGFKFTVVGDKRIRFGLGAVRNVGRAAIESILAARAAGPFLKLHTLVTRIDLRLCNKRVLESLIAAGACESLEGHRAQQTAAVETVLAEAQLLQQDRETGQGSLFGESPGARPGPPPLPDVPTWTEAERLAREKEQVGFFISGHPLAKFRAEVELFGTRTTATLGRWSDQPVTIGAVVTGIKRQISKKTGKEYARLVVEDFHGTAQALVFPDTWATINQTIVEDSCLLLSGGYSERDRGEDRAPFVIEGARPLDGLRLSGAVALAVRWARPVAPTGEDLRAVASVVAQHPGPAPVYIDWTAGNGESVRLRSRRMRVSPNEELVHALRSQLGPDAVRLVKAG
jgi:DNA polymerase-3 subunit alpha